ncbi:PREDICTED: uncharacterized protein LOC109226078 [Nicotiana attenuata]|uniref:uncharacterized protein LOC109222362 n=1 Tax=Nicotiana attenuata TaxID=49451 RepID=UPI0009049741|nr:PREDICTED: uncharacterized protein LOC109222362 [Nicotiana attenuata]XP_019246427.1 PREDICTED: uncharacterized protein LOC109226078 [Nicotiana attenuata]
MVETEKETEESEKTPNARPPPPFPQRLKKKIDDRMFDKFLDMLSQIQLNLPLVDVLRENLKYAKYIKDIVSNKRRLTEFETVALTEECTSSIQRKFPQKLKDPGSFTIPVRIGEFSVNWGWGPRPTTVMLQLADRSIIHLEGEIEDMLLQIGQFILPADFTILDYEADEHVPIIFGQPLLATTDVVIKFVKEK